ncbi:tRNA lysidine(34) synthetase TilS [Gemella sp. GH3]|uniref:tRNA lysidine(34) synthetase TilS n=1 Tax=unclassified Gemella TaxID=2624949 RepID=UPI0015D0CBBC|nr:MULTISPECIES: tRNA lysidine(34) synthetase TilS [unclassified Gemella]MBF0714077.1 tRNA lysidine(34) synthetase TilS [Gemella sp. GH3.1]NYS51029.1 tRNA lysidine(34) synthetase TilS [Gemella sp. GH3]
MKIKIMWNKNETIALALSGGVDSIVLFHLLINEYKDSYKKLVVFHINHGLREESNIEEAFVENLCLEKGIKFYKEKLYMTELEKSSHISEEMLARDLRYNAFSKFAEKENINRVLTAHHKNDNVENILLRLFTGRSRDYNLDIAEQSLINNLLITRPMLDIKKIDIELYAKDNNLKYYEDISNFNTDYTRNYIRHNIIPLLDNVNNNSFDNIINFANYYKNLNSVIKENIKSLISENIVIEKNKVSIHYKYFESLELVEKYLAINLMLNDYLEVFDVSKKAIFSSINNLTEVLGTKSYDLKENIKIIKEYQSLAICKIEKRWYNDKIEIIEEDIEGSKIYNFLENQIQVSTQNDDAELGFDSTDFPLLITTRQKGDTIKRGKITKKLSRLFIDEKIPRDIRDKLPVVRSSRGHIIGILGLEKNIGNKKNQYYIKIVKG